MNFLQTSHLTFKLAEEEFSLSDQRDTSLDFWSNAYRVKEYSTEFEFWSYGPDEIDDTEDDIWVVLKEGQYVLVR